MSNPQELIRTARRAIGDGEADDWKVNPSAHARMFERAAPTLADNLRRARPEGLAKMFEDKDHDAIRARDNFKRTASRADFSVFAAGSLAALLVVAVGLRDAYGEEASKYILASLGIAGVIASSFAAMWVGRARSGKLAQRWSNERANAEARRLSYFKDVMEGAHEDPIDRLFAFEYVRRFLLDNQIEYFQGRGLEHEKSAHTALDRSTYATFLASMLTAAGGALAVYFPDLGVVSGFAAVATHLGTYFTSKSETNLDRKNADRYSNVADALTIRRLDLDEYRLRVAEGDPDALIEFYEPIFMALSRDHQQFLSDGAQRESAIGNMAARIKAARTDINRHAGLRSADDYPTQPSLRKPGGSSPIGVAGGSGAASPIAAEEYPEDSDGAVG